MISPIQSSASALQALQGATAASAHNLANAQTAGFTPVQAVFAAEKSGGVRLNFSNSNSAPQNPNSAENPESGVDYTREAVNLSLYQKSFKANLAFIKAADRMTGEIIDLIA